MKTEFILPFPPSVNGLYANRRGGRCKTDKYKAWITEAGWMLQAQTHRHHRHTGPVSFTLIAMRPDNRIRDLDNLHKALQDLLVRHQIIGDDSQIVETHSRWMDAHGNAAKVIIEDLTKEGATP